jgi:predicted N-acyltransferase
VVVTSAMSREQRERVVRSRRELVCEREKLRKRGKSMEEKEGRCRRNKKKCSFFFFFYMSTQEDEEDDSN